MFYVRRKDDPSVILAWGHAEAGKYNFDTAIYEEAEGELPEGYIAAQPLPPLIDRLKGIINAIPVEGIPVEVRAGVRALEGQVQNALAGGDEGLAIWLVENATIPAELEVYRTQLLGEF